VCTSSDARDQRLRTSGLLRFTDAGGQERVILIDAGPDLRVQMLRAGIKRLDAILFTHNHVDHTFGLDEVRRFNAIMHAPIDIYANEHTLQHLRRVYAHIFDRQSNVNDSFVATLIAHRIEAGQTLDLFGVKVRAFALLHGKLPILGYRFDAGEGVGQDFLPMAYCTDVSAVPTETWRVLSGVKTLVLDALRHRHHPTHLTLEQAVNIAGQVDAERTYFVHMAHDLPHERTQADLPEGMYLAHDGLELG
jgi:phosphoribosyl 1,2-cyclic phosphate phosphodiesterase